MSLKDMNLKKTALISVVTLILSFASLAQAAETHHYKFQVDDHSGSSLFKVEQQWAKDVKLASGGRIVIDILPVQTVVKSSESLDAVSHGLIDGQIADTSYFSGQDPAFGLLGNTVGAWSDANQLLMFMEHGGGNELLQSLFTPYGVTLLGSTTTGVEALVSKVPLNGVADLKGLKLRTPEGLVSEVFSAAGASPVVLPTSEVYTSLDKGVIQAADYTVFSVNDAQGLNKIAPNPVYPGFHSLPLRNVAMNMKEYNKLPADLKEILRMSVIDLSRNMIGILKLKDLAAVANDKLNHPEIHIHDWSTAERNKFRAIARGVWKTYAKKSPNSEKVYDVLTKYLEKMGML